MQVNIDKKVFICKTYVKSLKYMTSTLPPNRELVVYALYTLGNVNERFHTEVIAIRCHELFPTSFSWTTRPDLPDKDIVRVSLVDARKEKYGVLVDGRSGQSRGLYQKTNRGPMSDGWKLTEAGIEWIHANRQRLGGLSSVATSKDHRQKSRKMLKRVRDHILFKEFQRDASSFMPGIGQLADLVRCRVDAESLIWNTRFEKLKRLAIETEQEDVVRFIAACLKAYEMARG